MSLNVYFFNHIQKLANRIDNLEELLSVILENNTHLENIVNLQNEQIKILKALIELDSDDGK